MVPKSKKKLIEYIIEAKKQNGENASLITFRNVSIFPKVLESRALSSFTDSEKKHLTRPGFRWYVRYSFRNPETGKFEQQNPVYLNINRFSDFDTRYKEIKLMRKGVIQALKQGFSPYEVREAPEYNVISALDFALDIKKSEVKSKRTYDGYRKSVKALQTFLKKRGFATYSAEDLKKKTVVEFLNEIAKKNSNRTRNNYRSDLSAVFTTLKENDLIKENFILDIKVLKITSKADRTYSDKQVETIVSDLEKSDRTLLLYIKMVSYMFWRPLENNRIKIKNIDLEERRILTDTKAKAGEVKRIPEILVEELEDYIKDASPEDYLFTPENRPGPWKTELNNRRNYFSKRFKKYKDSKGLPPEFTVYSFRHTFVTRAYKNLRERFPKEKAIEELKLLTGHNSKAIYEYIHYIDADNVEDYSDLLK